MSVRLRLGFVPREWRQDHTGHQAPLKSSRGYAFVPDFDFMAPISQAGASDWWGANRFESNAPSYGPLHRLEQQVAAFHRAGTVRILAATDLRDTPLMAAEGTVAGLALAPDGVGVSDIVLLAWMEGMPATLEAIQERMLGTSRVRAHEEIGIYWEVHGSIPGEKRRFQVVGG